MSDLDKIYKILLSDNILKYETELFKIIPELKNEKNFDQKNEWHCYDVWGHTLETINACDKNKEDRLILLLHDIGKPFSYQDDGNVRHFKNHAFVSAQISKEILKRLELSPNTMENMLKLIEMHSTKINLELISTENLLFFKRLIKIQKCDAKGYEEKHSLIILKELEQLENDLSKIKILKKQLN